MPIFCIRESQILTCHMGIFIFHRFKLKLELSHNFSRYIAVILQLDFLWKFFEKHVYILVCLMVNMIVIMKLIYKSFHHYIFNCKLTLETFS